VFCFDGEPVGKNTHKRGRGRSSLAKDNDRLFAFAREVCAKIRASSPYLIADQLLRIDFFEYRGRFIVNEVESFEAQTTGPDSVRIDGCLRVWWYQTICELVNFILNGRRANGLLID
jgi:hypothetical protein